MTVWRPVVALVFVLFVALGALFHRSLLRGEVFSPADLVFAYYPWAHAAERREPTNPTRSDEAVYHQSLMLTHWARLRGGDLPDWDPLVLGGVRAFFQGLNTGLLYSPFSVPFYVLPADIAVTVAAPLRLFCAGLFMWLFLRASGLGTPGGIAGALAFALNGGFIVWLSAPMPTVALYLPLALLLAERTVTRRDSQDAVALAIVLGLALTAAYLPTSIVLLFTTAAYAVWWMAARRAWIRAPWLAVALVGALAIAAGALVPMLANLFSSPAAGRAVSHVTLPPGNLATFALPDFWGNPVLRNWWQPTGGNYPEFVTYLGISTFVFAGTGLARLATPVMRVRVAFLAALAAFVMFYMYGVAPFSWLSGLPGLRQTNPYRFNVALAFAIAALAGHGVDALLKPEGVSRRWLFIGALAGVVLLAAGVAVGLAAHLPDIRIRSLQEFEKGQIWRSVWFAAAAVAIACVALVVPRRRVLAGAAAAAIGVIGWDLVSALGGFNPTLPRAQVYPTTPAIEFLKREAGNGRVAPVGDTDLIQGHVWSVYGIPTITGFDFHGSEAYQRFLARGTGRRFEHARWDYVGIGRDARLDLRLLGLLGVSHIVTSPEDAATREGGYETTGELTAGRVLRQTFRATGNGLRRVDVLTATYERQNVGRLRLSLLDVETRATVNSRDVEVAAIPNNAWLVLDVPEQHRSKGRAFAIELRALEGAPGRSVTAWMTQQEGHTGGVLEIDGRATARDLWFRTFVTAPDRFAGARLVYANDLNIYRNDRAMPRAWFAEHVARAPLARHAEILADASFDLRSTALLDAGSPAVRTVKDATVARIDAADPDALRVEVDAPEGGLLVVSERFDPGWRAWVDGVPARVLPADAVLTAVEVPPGTRSVILEFRYPGLRSSLALSGVALAAAVSVLLLKRR